MNRTTGTSFVPQQNTAWAQPQHAQGQLQGQVPARKAQRQPFGAANDHFGSHSASDRSDSANEVENMLMNTRAPARTRRMGDQGGWTNSRQRPQQRVFAPTMKRMTGFKPVR